MIIGLVGGVGSGKSTVTSVLKEYGFKLLLTDDIAKELELPGGSCYKALVRHFGDSILKAGDGSPIDNAALAARIYSDPEALKTVNGIVHPMVWNYVEESIAAETAKSSEAALHEAGDEAADSTANVIAVSMGDRESSGCAGTCMHAAEDKAAAGNWKGTDLRIAVETALPGPRFTFLCDEIWFIYTEQEIRIERLMSDRGYSREKSLSVIAQQHSDEEFRGFADVIIDNSGEREETVKQVRKHLDEIL